MDYACGDSTAPTAGIRNCSAPPTRPVNQGFRRVEPRHTPTFFAATLNFDNFWDGRARHDYNGGSVFGAADPQAHVMVHDPTPRPRADATDHPLRQPRVAGDGPGAQRVRDVFSGRNWPSSASGCCRRT
jgi:hypothetical protein